MPKNRYNDQNSNRAILTQATDIITINAGGFLYMICKSTLLSSGARFFHDMFKQTGEVLEKGSTIHSSVDKNNNKKEDLFHPEKSEKITSEEQSISLKDKTLFLDCDPYVFSDVLYFMRRNRIAPETKADPLRLEKLKIEAEFFSYNALWIACNKHLEAVRKFKKDFLENKSSARSGSVTAHEGNDKVIYVPDGQVLFIVSATLAGECRARRYGGYDDSNIPGCYINTCEKEHTGDFQLHYYHIDSEGRSFNHLRCCIAHVGLDQVHCEGIPLNVNFREDLRLCISPQSGHNWIALGSSGAGSWHVHYWLGHPNAIPELKTSSDQGLVVKKRKLQSCPRLTVDKKKKLDSSVFISKMNAFG